MTALTVLTVITGLLMLAATGICAKFNLFEPVPEVHVPNVGEAIRVLIVAVIYLVVWVVPTLLATVIWAVWLR